MNKYIVEFLGTLFLVFVILATGNWLAIGAALAVAVLLGGAISGGAYNPAVTLALLAAGKIPSSDVIPYIVAQVAGGLAAFELVKILMKK
jgi:aquaporin Z|uniref:Major intrinsic protein n=1 Tax=viral metagenome TaxID=1070528 RepID=A0A6C0HDG5_9ZZZZ